MELSGVSRSLSLVHPTKNRLADVMTVIKKKLIFFMIIDF
jgi:hypothetical protein